jgi:hypothetical protein
MRSRFAIAILDLLCADARAQYVVDAPAASLRAPLSETQGTTVTIKVQLEALNSGGAPALAGSAVTVAPNLAADSVILVDLPGNKTTAVSVVSARATIMITGTVGWQQVTATTRFPFPAPVAVQAGKKLGCRYDMPGQTWTFDLKTLTASWAPAGQGRFRCAQPGVLASTIPDLIAPVTPPPAPAPAPVPAPVLTWTTIAQQHQVFTLAAAATVRYGEIATNRFVQQTLAAGSYACDNAQFTDPAVGVDAKVCQAQK